MEVRYRRRGDQVRGLGERRRKPRGREDERRVVRDGEDGADELNQGGIGTGIVWQKDTVHHARCLAAKRGRTKFNQDLSPVSSHCNTARGYRSLWRTQIDSRAPEPGSVHFPFPPQLRASDQRTLTCGIPRVQLGQGRSVDVDSTSVNQRRDGMV